jgi:hypothetical protein
VPQLSYDQVKQLWVNAGGDPAYAPIAAGIAWGESRWITDAVNPNSPDYGLWQFTYAGNMNAIRRDRWGSPESLLTDPQRQANAIVAEYGNRLQNARVGFGGNPADPSTADVIFRVWDAATQGRLDPPTDQQVLLWTSHDLATPRSGGTSGVLPDPLTGGSAIGAGGSVEGATTAAAEKFGCNLGTKGFSLSTPNLLGNWGSQDIASGIGNACQLKALTGGLFVGVGVGLLLTGAVLVVSQTGAGKKAVGAASGLIPGAGTVRSLQSSNRLPVERVNPGAEQRAAFDAANPSPARQEATRRARSGTLGARSYTMDDLADLF